MPFQEGFTKLWTGLGPNVARNAIINAAELASYDQVKQVRCTFNLSYLLSLLIQIGITSVLRKGSCNWIHSFQVVSWESQRVVLFY